uniref:DUF4378 domain-containing protein n=1 Tax=Davidia involucrata TaxID=16924 RepID=A0A5B6YJQ9_DAVIN
MGKEWLYWGNGGSRSTKRGRSQERDSTTPPGCMCAVLQLFDFHQFQFTLNQQPSFKPESFLPEEPTILKGVEAPRNSLELEETFMGATSLSSTMKEGENLNIQMGIQIKTRGESTRSSKARTGDSSSECGSSPGTKTPNLVARLMGLDLVPESSSPSFSSTPNPLSKSHLHPRVHNLKQDYFQSRQLLQSRSSSAGSRLDADIMGTRSLPETPRVSLTRRSDVDHRLSLQINKENIGVSEEFEFSKNSAARRRELKVLEDENRSPSNYARQIVKQVKESVSRKVGIDITNTIKNRERERVVEQLKSKKLFKGLTRTGEELSPSKQLTLTQSCSPRLRFLEPKNKPVTTLPANKNPKLLSVDKQSRLTKVSSKPKSTQPLQERIQQQHQNSTRKAVSERFSLKKPPKTSDAMRNKKQEEPFVRTPPTSRTSLSDKKTPLSNDLLNINVPTLLSLKKDPSPSATKLPQKQCTHLSSYSSHRYKQEEATHMPTVQDSSSNDRSNDATTDDGAEFQYIARIMKRTGIDRNTPVLSFTKWYSPSHPLDPSIFHHLEPSFPTTTTNSQLNQRCNRKLLFQLVDEILVQLLRPYINLKPWDVTSITRDSKMYGSQLIDTLCAKIRSFPSADCQVLEDIDGLIETDLCKYQLSQRSVAFEEDGEGIVSEIERDIVDSLVHETAMEVFGVARPFSNRNFFWTEVQTGSDGRHMGLSRDEMPFVGCGPHFPMWPDGGLVKRRC